MAHPPPNPELTEDIASILSSLEGLPELPVIDHVALFDTVQRQLSDLLSDVDDV